MKRITHYCLFVLCTLVFPFTGFSQENARVTLNMKDVSLLEVFDEITKQTQYEFVYSKPLIDKDMTVAGKLKWNTDLIRIFENVPIGISVQDVFDMAGGLADGYGEIIMGGPFTGKRV